VFVPHLREAIGLQAIDILLCLRLEDINSRRRWDGTRALKPQTGVDGLCQLNCTDVWTDVPVLAPQSEQVGKGTGPSRYHQEVIVSSFIEATRSEMMSKGFVLLQLFDSLGVSVKLEFTCRDQLQLATFLEDLSQHSHAERLATPGIVESTKMISTTSTNKIEVRLFVKSASVKSIFERKIT
jgi:hypothetical protein